jgi:hypothetical protein
MRCRRSSGEPGPLGRRAGVCPLLSSLHSHRDPGRSWRTQRERCASVASATGWGGCVPSGRTPCARGEGWGVGGRKREFSTRVDRRECRRWKEVEKVRAVPPTLDRSRTGTSGLPKGLSTGSREGSETPRRRLRGTRAISRHRIRVFGSESANGAGQTRAPLGGAA